MSFRSKGIAREVGNAVAVLAIYLLVLLAPWHQASGLQHELTELGYSAPAGWAICEGAVPDNGTDTSSKDVRCPLAGVGKHGYAGLLLATTEIFFPPPTTQTSYPFDLKTDRHPHAPMAGQPRAPPVPV